METPFSCPIFFIHNGNNSYLKYVLSQARYFNNGKKIFLIGDRKVNKYNCVDFHYIEEHFSEATEFRRLYQHLSTNDFNYELFCFQRWFILKDFVFKYNINTPFFYFDSDVLLFTNIDDIIKDFNLYKYSFTVSYGSSPHCIFFLNKNILKDFCNFITNIYTDKNLYLKIVIDFLNSNLKLKKRKRSGGGGICDMTALKEFTIINKNFIDLSQTMYNNSCFDHNINCADGYKFNKILKIKKVFVNNNKVYSYNNIIRDYIRLYGLHFQGSAKYLIPTYYIGKEYSKLDLNNKFKIYISRVQALNK